MTKQTIGEHNGVWAFALRLNLVLVPIALTALIALNVWFVESIHALDVRASKLESTYITEHELLQTEQALRDWHTDDLRAKLRQARNP